MNMEQAVVTQLRMIKLLSGLQKELSGKGWGQLQMMDVCFYLFVILS